MRFPAIDMRGDPDLLLVNAHDPLLLFLAQHRQRRRAPET